MEKMLPIWILVLLSLGVMLIVELKVQRPLEYSINPVDEAMQSLFEMKVSVSSSGFAW